VVVAPSSSSTKKAAKLAKSGQGKKVRFQGGTLFPVVVTLVVVLGLALVVYSRQSRPSVDASGAPQVSDHWHHAYGFYLCDTWFQLEGDAEQQGSENFNAYRRTGVHSHDDGLIHWHPFTSAAVGSNARLGVFLDTYGVELTNSKVTFPENQEAAIREQFASADPPNEELVARENVLEWEDGDQCPIDGTQRDANVKVVVWNNFTDTDDGTTYIADFDNIRLDRDQMVVVIAFVPDGTDVGMPPWAPQLPSLGAIDSGVIDPNTGLTPGATVPVGSTPDTGAPDESAPDTTADVPSTTEG
jgi:hypothetical protein